MIEIMHRAPAQEERTYIIAKHDEPYTLYINTDLLKADMSKYKNEVGKTDNKIDNNNLKNIVKYIDRAYKMVDKATSTIDISWYAGEDGLPKAYPVQFVHEPIYKFNMCNYIELEKYQRLVSINIKELNDVIAYEFIHRDLGETHASIEELLHDCGIISNSDIKMLHNRITEESPDFYSLAKSMMVGETIYLNMEKQQLYDYFNSKVFDYKYKKTYYKDVLKYSCKYAMTLVANSILKKAIDAGKKLHIISISDTEVNIIIEDTNISPESFKENLMEDITIQIFGRKFRVEPSIEII